MVIGYTQSVGHIDYKQKVSKTHLEGRRVFTSVIDVSQSKLTDSLKRVDADVKHSLCMNCPCCNCSPL